MKNVIANDDNQVREILSEELRAFHQAGMSKVSPDLMAAALGIRREIETQQGLLDLLHRGKLTAKMVNGDMLFAETICPGDEFKTNNEFSDTVTFTVKSKLDDGSFLVKERTNCCEKYQHEHPDKYVVMTSGELWEMR
jgi:hypothetical protein